MSEIYSRLTLRWETGKIDPVDGVYKISGYIHWYITADMSKNFHIEFLCPVKANTLSFDKLQAGIEKCLEKSDLQEAIEEEARRLVQCSPTFTNNPREPYVVDLRPYNCVVSK